MRLPQEVEQGGVTVLETGLGMLQLLLGMDLVSGLVTSYDERGN